MANIGQLYYNVIDTSGNGNGKKYISTQGLEDAKIFDLDLINFYGAKQFIKVGIQAPPGAQIIMNGNKTIMIGRTGIYELDEDIAITSLKFVRPVNYILNEDKTATKKEEGEAAIKKAKEDLETALANLGPEPEDKTSEDYKIYWASYIEINDAYITAYQEANNILNQGLNGVYEKDSDNPNGDLENVIIDFIYDAQS